uniref:Uncharacterized protein n=1 Tax=Rhizophora mucronata TaxID=61149 RepID=A0A2P2K2X7_RHIMU
MDLLFKAYSQSSDEEPEPEPEPGPKPRTGYRTTVMHPPKRHKPDNPQTIQRETSIPGRYISKRERTQAASVSDTNPNPNPAVVASPGKSSFLFLIVVIIALFHIAEMMISS